MIFHFRSRLSSIPRPLTTTLLFLILLLLLLFHSHRRLTHLPPSFLETYTKKASAGSYAIPQSPLNHPPTVHLVVASTKSEDYTWTQNLRVPNLLVIPYIADNSSAQYHPVKNKGHEAMIYHQYFYDFYEALPDVVILIHSQMLQWHVDGILEQSMLFSINHLDMREVQRRQFCNLRVTWGFSCSSGSINTTKVIEENPNVPEQKDMREAFRANFNLYDIPSILATPCCSQIAVTRERIRSVPREQYQHHIDWLLTTPLPDAISGRTWEHMWHYLFLGKAIDCPIEHKAYCRLYHICFGGREKYDEWVELNQGRGKLQEELLRLDGQLREGQKVEAGVEFDKENIEERVKERTKTRNWLTEELGRIQEEIRIRREVAIVRGGIEANRLLEGEGLYGEDGDGGVVEEMKKEREKPAGYSEDDW